MNTNALHSSTFGNGPNLVLLHGWGLNGGVWTHVAERLQHRFRITIIDLPGFGRSAQCYPAGYSLHAVSKLVEKALPEQYSLLGWSLGGLIAQHIAATNPVGLKNLVLIASTPKFADDSQWPGIKAPVLHAFEKQLSVDFSRTLERFLAIQAMGSESAKTDIKQIKQWVQQHPQPAPLALNGGLSLLANVDLRDQLEKIQVPTLRMYGRLDSLVPAAVHEYVDSLHPASRSLVFAKASHAPFISHPEEFVKAVVEFVL